MMPAIGALDDTTAGGMRLHSSLRTGSHRLTRRAATLSVAAMLAGLAMVAPGAVGLSATPAATMTCKIVPFAPSSNFHGDHSMHDIDAIATDDIWAVGEDDGAGKALAYHWNGQHWKQSTPAPPSAGFLDSIFTTVAARASNDVWAFGIQSSHTDEQLLIEHWNGHHWAFQSGFAFPGISFTWNLQIQAAVAISASDAWVVGYAGVATGPRVFALHWNGHTWSRTTLPASAGYLTDITGSAVHGVWAIGGDYPVQEVYRWDGSSWQVAHSSNAVNGALGGIDVTKSGRVVAVGSADNERSSFALAGPSPSWVTQPMPATKYDYTSLADVAAVSGSNIWAIGSTGPIPHAQHHHYPAIYHWSGARWSKIATPLDGKNGVQLESVTSVPGSKRVYAVGSVDYGFGVPTDLLITRIC